MPKGLTYFLFIITFIIGVSVGVYSKDFIFAKDNKENESNIVIAKSVQDNVIEKVQNNDLWNNNLSKNYDNEKISGDNEENVIEVFIGEEKVSPDAKLVIKKIFKKCNHSTVNIIDVPDSLINLTEKEIAKKYNGWTIEKFSSNEIIISRDIDANCEDHYVVREENGIVNVYNELSKENMNFIENVQIDYELLGDEEKEKLKEGIRVYGKKELSSLLENYVSERRSSVNGKILEKGDKKGTVPILSPF